MQNNARRPASPEVPAVTPPAVGSAAAAGERAGAVTDVVNLFAHFGAAGAAAAYQEIQSDTAATAAALRWPLLREWIGGATPAEPER